MKTMPDRYGELPFLADAVADILTRGEYADVTGKYFDRSTRISRSSELSYNEENAKKLWDISLEMTGLQ